MRVAIIHFWLVGMRGGEKVLESLCRMFPDADIYTHCLDREVLSPLLQQRTIYTTFINKLPFSKKLYKYYLPFMPLALEQLSLKDYDLVISCESGPAKGVLVPASVPHICYCHTPMRYLWDFSHEYVEKKNFLLRPLMYFLLHRLRIWDAVSALRVDRYVANSSCVARRIARWWGKSANVVNPPVELPSSDISITECDREKAPYVFFSQLVSYKRADLAIRACHLLGRKLVIAGDGEERDKLEKLANSLGAVVSFLGRLPDSSAKWHFLSHSRALLFPGEEDFGIIPIEAMACGCPVIAYGVGGVLDSVREGKDGVFFFEQTPESLASAICEFEKRIFAPDDLRARAEEFSEERFQREMYKEIDEVLKGHRSPAC